MSLTDIPPSTPASFVCESCGTEIVELPTVAENYTVVVERKSCGDNATFYKKTYKLHACKERGGIKRQRKKEFEKKAKAYLGDT